MDGDSKNIKNKCTHCAASIDKNAKICNKCGKNQNIWWYYIEQLSGIVAIILVLVAISQTLIAFQQMKSAIRKNVDATKALNEALNAKSIADSASKELFKLKSRSNLTLLADSAMANGSRLAFEKLVVISKDTLNKNLNLPALSEIRRIKSFYGPLDYIGVLIDTTSQGKIKKDKDFSTEELIFILSNDKSWERRACAADLLYNNKKKSVLEALYKAIKEDPHLAVADLAMSSFSDITGFDDFDYLGFEEIYKFWNNNKEEILNKLEN